MFNKLFFNRKISILLLLVLTELYVCYYLTIANLIVFNQAYCFKKELMKKFSCEISDYVVKNSSKILMTIFFITVIAGSSGIGIGILAIFVFSQIGLSPYVSYLIFY
jgi:hypothetical protein